MGIFRTNLMFLNIDEMLWGLWYPSEKNEKNDRQNQKYFCLIYIIEMICKQKSNDVSRIKCWAEESI